VYREYIEDDFTELLRMRYSLFFDEPQQETYDTFMEDLQGHPYYDLWTMFVYQRDNGMLGGFIEIGFIYAKNYAERLGSIR
jgi:hypothetical protein